MKYTKDGILRRVLHSSDFFLAIFFLLLSFFSNQTAFCQNISSQEIKRKQRSIYIFNFAQQVSWEDFDAVNVFKIGVLGPDVTVSDLRSTASNRTIFGKPVEIVRLQFVKEIDDIQLLYVNQKYNYEIEYILSKIEGKGILLVTEDYEFNTSMINIVNIGNSFEYEINEQRISDAGFVAAESLKQHSITSAKQWQELFKSSRESLEKKIEEKTKEIGIKEQEIKQRDKTISEQYVDIDSSKERILARNKQIKQLLDESNVQEKKYQEKLKIEQELEKNIKEQVKFIKLQEEKIVESDQLIKTQLDHISKQSEKIAEQDQVLLEQISTLKDQKK